MLIDFADLCLCTIPLIAETMSYPSASRRCTNLIYSTGPAVASGRVYGLRQPQQIISLNLMLTQTWTEHVSLKWLRNSVVETVRSDCIPVNVTVHSSGGVQSAVQVLITSANETSSTAYNGTSDVPSQFTVPSPKLWSPDSPTLYNLTVTMGADQVTSYTGFRTISKGVVDGVVRPLLNGEFIFMFGTLDQGYWPDGLYTPPNREAMVYDLEVLKSLGFNMLRKHVSYPQPPFFLSFFFLED
jgi:beta-galactosidase/beta-glucuronidase